MKQSKYNVWQEFGNSAYVYNGVSGALLSIPLDDYETLTRYLSLTDDASPSPHLLAQLARGRMVIPDDADEISFLARRYSTSRSDTHSFGLTIVTSLGCNFDCPYCFEDKQPSIMDEEVQNLVVGVLEDQLPRITAFRVTWYGGEPLIGKRSLLGLSDRFIACCDASGVSYRGSIITNGSLLDKATASDLRDRRVTTAQVTLDGPPDVHDRMRPYVSGKGSFWGIIENLHHATEYLAISVRVNVDKDNISRTEDLLRLLADEGFSGKLSVYPGHIVAVDAGVPSPSASYRGCCFTNAEFAQAQLRFSKLAEQYGFSAPNLPRPVSTPCTAVRANEIVVGSRGELYKCWESVGSNLEVIGDIRDYDNPNGRLQKWLKYDPFENPECRNCIALPVCMGGCASHAMDPRLYENRCGTFRTTYREQVLAFVESAARCGVQHSVATAEPGSPVEIC